MMYERYVEHVKQLMNEGKISRELMLEQIAMADHARKREQEHLQRQMYAQSQQVSWSGTEMRGAYVDEISAFDGEPSPEDMAYVYESFGVKQAPKTPCQHKSRAPLNSGSDRCTDCNKVLWRAVNSQRRRR